MRTLSADAALAGAARRHSLSRAGTSIEEIASELVGLHNTTQASPYLSIRARLPGFERAHLEALMWESWRMARIRAMRLTMFVFPVDLLTVSWAATRHLGAPFAARWLRDSGLSQEEFDRISATVRDALGDGPLTVRGLRRALDVPPKIDLPGIVGRMCDIGQIVGGAPPRSWRSTIRRYHRWEDVLPGVDLRTWNERDAICELIRRYIGSYGPVTLDDMSWWTGITKGRCRAALAALGAEIEEVAVDGWPGPSFCAPDDPGSDDPGSGVSALPILDPYVQGYRDRIRLLEPTRNGFVYDGGGNATATLVHRGTIIGVWQATTKPVESVRYHLFSGGPQSVRRVAEAELAATGSFYFDRAVDVVEVKTMKPLTADGGRSASHPLDSTPHRASRRRQA